MSRASVVVLSVFAILWFVWGISALRQVPLGLIALPVAISLALGVAGWIKNWPPRALSKAEIGRIIGIASAGEGVAIFAANVALALTGHADFCVCATLAIVGLHFLPLAHYIGYARYYLTAGAMVGLAIVACLIPDPLTRLEISGLGGAAILWLTILAGIALRQTNTVAAARQSVPSSLQ